MNPETNIVEGFVCLGFPMWLLGFQIEILVCLGGFWYRTLNHLKTLPYNTRNAPILCFFQTQFLVHYQSSITKYLIITIYPTQHSLSYFFTLHIYLLLYTQFLIYIINHPSHIFLNPTLLYSTKSIISNIYEIQIHLLLYFKSTLHNLKFPQIPKQTLLKDYRGNQMKEEEQSRREKKREAWLTG